jgi:hypothetical protein
LEQAWNERLNEFKALAALGAADDSFSSGKKGKK